MGVLDWIDRMFIEGKIHIIFFLVIILLLLTLFPDVYSIEIEMA